MPKRTLTSKTSKLLSAGIFKFDPSVDPKTLKPHKQNWRKHTHRQRQAFNAHHERVGWTDAVIVNVTTGNIVDGHMRWEESCRKKTTVPVLYGRWTKEQELEILATKDPLGALAETQADALQALNEQIHGQLQQIKSPQSNTLKKLVADIDNYAAEITTGDSPAVLLNRRRDRKEYDRAREAAKDDEPESLESDDDDSLPEDPIFPSRHPFGLPDLLPDMLCTEVPDSIWDRSPASVTPNAYYCYSAGPGTIPDAASRGGGFLGFFTEDFRFEKTWNDTAGFTDWLRDMDFKGVLAPDYSTWTDWPLALRIHNLYRSRWVARYWQESGIPVIPIIQSLGACPGLDRSAGSFSNSLCLDSLPKKLPVVATEARNSQGAEDYWIGWAALHKHWLSTLRIGTLVIYGGEENQKRFLPRLGKTGRTEIVLLSSFISRRRKGQK